MCLPAQSRVSGTLCCAYKALPGHEVTPVVPRSDPPSYSEALRLAEAFGVRVRVADIVSSVNQVAGYRLTGISRD